MEEERAVLRHGKVEHPLEVFVGTEGESGLDIGRLLSSTGMVALDYGFANTAWCRSAVSFVDGNVGALRYRGYPIEQLAEHSCFLEVSYLLFHGELPTLAQLAEWREAITVETLLDEGMRQMFDACPREAHPMVLLSAAVTAMGAFHPELESTLAAEQAAIHLLAKVPTAAAFSYRRSRGLPYAYPRRSLDYCSRFLQMTFSVPGEEYEVDPVAARALDVLLILHADHEQNCSTSTVRLVGSSRATVFASVASGVNALSGPLHGGANQEVLELLQQIHADGGNYAKYLARAKDREDTFRLPGFGHRIYRSYDPRAGVLKTFADQLVTRQAGQDPLLEIALALEQTALTDDYFIERHLYPNVDFYSGILFRALGFPTRMFPVLFALGRFPGWIAQWKEMTEDPETRIGRPRQVYVGSPQRDYVPVHERR
ncbi:MAG: citrate synthase [Acidimicrobiia bacterium]|nr:citrate synthase [Acidimicrobiia bacterium]